MKNTIKIFLTVISLILLASCDLNESRHNLSGGELLDDEMISEIKSGITETESETVAEENTGEDHELDTSYDPDAIVYWTGSGSVWHKSPDCTHIKNATDLYAGKISDAEANGKSAACSKCCD